jgi:hypothetical protein
MDNNITSDLFYSALEYRAQLIRLAAENVKIKDHQLMSCDELIDILKTLSPLLASEIEACADTYKKYLNTHKSFTKEENISERIKLKTLLESAIIERDQSRQKLRKTFTLSL